VKPQSGKSHCKRSSTRPARAKRISFGAGSTFTDHHHLEPLKIDPRCATALESPTVLVIVGR